MLHHKRLEMPVICPRTCSISVVSTTAITLFGSYVLGTMEMMRGNLPTDVHQLLIVNEAGGKSTV